MNTSINAPPLATTVLTAARKITGLHDLNGLEQHGRDNHAHFRMTLGVETVDIGSIDVLMSRHKLHARLLTVATRGLLPFKAADWEAALEALLKHATLIDEAIEDTTADEIREMLEQYVTDNHLADRDTALNTRAAFTADELLHLSGRHFALWIRRTQNEQIENREVRAALRSLGFIPTRLNWQTGTGQAGRTNHTAHYYAGRMP
jgi:hypothetical protein